MSKCNTTGIDGLIRHQQTIKRTLADFAHGRKTGHLSAMEIDQVVRGLNERLTDINERLTSIAR